MSARVKAGLVLVPLIGLVLMTGANPARAFFAPLVPAAARSLALAALDSRVLGWRFVDTPQGTHLDAYIGKNGRTAQYLRLGRAFLKSIATHAALLAIPWIALEWAKAKQVPQCSAGQGQPWRVHHWDGSETWICSVNPPGVEPVPASMNNPNCHIWGDYGNAGTGQTGGHFTLYYLNGSGCPNPATWWADPYDPALVKQQAKDTIARQIEIRLASPNIPKQDKMQIQHAIAQALRDPAVQAPADLVVGKPDPGFLINQTGKVVSVGDKLCDAQGCYTITSTGTYTDANGVQHQVAFDSRGQMWIDGQPYWDMVGTMPVDPYGQATAPAMLTAPDTGQTAAVDPYSAQNPGIAPVKTQQSSATVGQNTGTPATSSPRWQSPDGRPKSDYVGALQALQGVSDTVAGKLNAALIGAGGQEKCFTIFHKTFCFSAQPTAQGLRGFLLDINGFLGALLMFGIPFWGFWRLLEQA